MRPGDPPSPPGLPLLVLTPTEERYVLAERLTPQVYTIPRLTRIEGRLDAGRLAAAIDALIRRNPALRSGFTMDGTGKFHKYIVPEPPAQLEIVDLPGATQDEINDYLRPRLMEKPDLSPPSLGRYHLLRIGPDLQYLSLSWHHSISDGTSARLAVEEIFAYYEGQVEVVPAPAPHQLFADDWATTEPCVSQLHWWEQQLAGAPEQLDLPPDLDWADGPAVRALDHPLSSEACAALATGAARFGVSEFAVAYAVLLNLLSRLTGTTDVLTSFQSNGRRAMPDSVRSIGGYSNALVLRAPIAAEQSFASYVADLGARIRQSVAHEFPPYHHVIAKTGVHPRFGVNWFPAPPELEVASLHLFDSSHDLRESDYQLNVRFIRSGDARRMVVYYQAQQLSQQRMELLVRQFEALAVALVARADQPMAQVRLADLQPLPPPAEPYSATAPGESIAAGFLRQAALQPQQPALWSAAGVLSYAQLLARAAGVAATLHEAGVPPGVRVAVLGRRNAAFVVNLLGVVLHGGSFVVLDEAYPDDRLTKILEAVAADVLLVPDEEGMSARAQTLSAEVGVPMVQADPLREAKADPYPVDPTAPAYYLFTSGTTGEPKGVALSHQPLAHFTRWQIERFAITSSDRITMFSGLGHDPLLRDIFTTLGAGATLLVPTQDDLLLPGALPAWVAQAKPTISHLTPPLGELLLAGAADGALRSLRLLFWGGDLLRPILVERIRAVAPDAVHVNFYGSTETPQAAAAYPLNTDQLGPWHSVPVGWATAGHRLRVVDGEGQALGAWQPGEVEVGSELLSLGRLDRGAIVPFATPDIYRTGDRGLHRADGAVQLVGRLDDQVKVRGHRIEPMEVANAIEAHPEVSRAIVLADGEGAQRRLVAFTVDSIEESARVASLSGFVARRLPLYMVPEQFISIKAMPLLPNGKIDRAALRAILAARQAERVAQAPAASKDEQRLIDKWRKVLGRDDITPEDSLISLGGDSLNFVNLFLATEEVLGAVPDGWQVMRIRDLCASELKPAAFFRPVDTAVLTRAIAITIVVAEHLRLIPYVLNGATTGLFLVTGYFFGSLQLTTAFHNRTIRPLLRMMGNLLIPVLLFSLLLYGWKTFEGKNPHISVLTLTGNFHDFRGGNYGGREYYLWYIYAMVQILLLILLATWLAMRLQAREVDPWRFSLTLFGIGVVLRFGLPAMFVPGFFTNGIEVGDIWSYLPTTHLPTVMLGSMILFADTDRKRLWLVPVLLLYAAGQLWFFPESGGGYYTLVFGLALLFVRRVPLPRLLSNLLLPISGASLYLYLTHFQFAGILKRLGIHQPLVQVIWAMVCGVLLWRLYSWLVAQVNAWSRQRANPNGKDEETQASL